MQQAVAKLYSRLIHFMVHALQWYRKSQAKQAIGAIFKPFALDFQDQLTEVNELSRTVDEIATTAAQAELRAVHARVEDVNKELGLARLEIKSLSELVSLQADRVFQVASCMSPCLPLGIATNRIQAHNLYHRIFSSIFAPKRQ
jgi:hypothetical protein